MESDYILIDYLPKI